MAYISIWWRHNQGPTNVMAKIKKFISVVIKADICKLATFHNNKTTGMNNVYYAPGPAERSKAGQGAFVF